MSKRGKTKAQTSSTVEAIKMASASVLGTTTSKGVPIGSATGSGTMLDQNSELIAMNITPLIFSIRDALQGAEGLDLLSLEWDLEHSQGSQVLPEHLVVTGRSVGDVTSQLCTISWEKGVVDPFKIDNYIANVAKKLSDIEKAVIGNEMKYETDGLAVLRKFSDRLNSVTFVEILDRQFQADWSSVQIKPEHVDIEAIVKMKFHDDFTLSPPGPRIENRTSIEFNLPIGDEESRIQHFKSRIYSPGGLVTLAARVPEVGRAILSELNTYAYSIEEVDIARATIALFVKFLGREEIFPEELEEIEVKINEFVGHMTKAVDIFSEITSEHATSGAKITIDDHHKQLHAHISERSGELDELGILYMKALSEHLMGSIRRDFPVKGKIRAWQMRSSFSYFSTFSKSVIQYFSEELFQFLLVTSVKKVLLTTLQHFREEMIAKGLDSTDTMLFHKFYAELYSVLNAIIDSISFEGSKQESIEDLISIISRDTMDAFSKIEILNLVGFSDVADIAKREVQTNHSSDGETLTDKGNALMNLLTFFERFVSETLPDVGDTILSKETINPIIDKVVNGGTNLIGELREAINQEQEKPQEWKTEALSWMDDLETQTNEITLLSEQLLTLLNVSYSRLGSGITATSIVDRVGDVVSRYQTEYEDLTNAWSGICKEVDTENVPIRESNILRASQLTKAKDEFEAEQVKFEQELTRYNEQSALGTPEVVSPKVPESLEDRRLKIYDLYPMREEKPHPPKPEPSDEMAYYIDLHALLDEKLKAMNQSQTRMEEVFSERLKVLRLEGAEIARGVSIGVSTDFLEYLMNSVIRKLARLLPRSTRAYLRHPENPDLIYLVSYEHIGDELTVSIGNNLLRRK
ncbi:MAG: hypothetical protein ACTSU3_07755 [Candidatus Thorarchaeota archaeon]